MTSVRANLRYRIGHTVPETGAYLCIPCGYVQEFKAGERFTTCEACFAGTPDGPYGYTDPASEFWEAI